MAKRENFNDLVCSIQDAFLQVNEMSEMQHIEMLRNYFDEENNPICIEINYPFIEQDGRVTYHAMSVPKLCLVPISSLKLSEVMVDFKVKLYGKISLKEAENVNTEEKNLLQATSKKQEKEQSYLGYVSGGFGMRKDNDDNYAHIILKFTSEEAPEGLMRISDEMIKVMLR